MKSVVVMIDNLIERAVFKTFKASHEDVIRDIRQFLRLHDVALL